MHRHRQTLNSVKVFGRSTNMYACYATEGRRKNEVFLQNSKISSTFAAQSERNPPATTLPKYRYVSRQEYGGNATRVRG